jgi:dTDP-L-rhamnose 4-epimerase
VKVLVTGGAGFIGSHVVDLLVRRGDEITVLDNLDPQVHGAGAADPAHILEHVRSGAVRFLWGDVTRREAVAFASEGTDAVVHLAAAVGVGQSMYQPYHYVHTNATGTGVILDAVVAARATIKKLIVASSMSIYGEGAYHCGHCGGSETKRRDPTQLARGVWGVLCAACGGVSSALPTPEGKPPDIRSIYAATKKHQEDLFLSLGDAYGIPTFGLRFFNVYGRRQALSNPYTGVAAIFLSRLLTGSAPLVFEDGLQTRDLIDVRDVARAVLLALDSPATGAHAVNIGTGRAVTVLQVARILAERLGTHIEPQTLREYRAGDIRHCFAAISLAKALLGFEAHHLFDDAVEDLITWCREAQAMDRLEDSLGELRLRGLVR